MGCFGGGAGFLERLPPLPDVLLVDVDFFCVVDATVQIPPWRINIILFPFVLLTHGFSSLSSKYSNKQLPIMYSCSTNFSLYQISGLQTFNQFACILTTMLM
jgi:hypothetical protein